jgi:hypothetical protein
MKALIFEPFSGASGDMIVGSLLDLGVKESKIADAISAFDLELEVEEVNKQGIVAKKVEFVTTSARSMEGAITARSYTDIVSVIEHSGLDNEIIQNALGVFERLAHAEATVHGEPKESLHFHELGAWDTIGDLVGSAVAFRELRPEIVISTPISVGTGVVETEHGLLPVPTPATVELLRDTSLIYRGGPFESASELLTPTGAALFAHFVQRSEPFLPQMYIERVGYGAGSRDGPVPNVLRASLGAIEGLSRDAIEVLETNVDSISGEVLGNLIEVLMAEGAKDVTIAPVLMKKGRAGHIIKVITAPQDAARLAYRIMEETGSLGVRVMQVKHRFVANREEKKVKVSIQGVEREVGVKIGRNAEGAVLTVAVEFEDAKRIANELKLPLKDVMRIVEGTFFYK